MSKFVMQAWAPSPLQSDASLADEFAALLQSQHCPFTNLSTTGPEHCAWVTI